MIWKFFYLKCRIYFLINFNYIQFSRNFVIVKEIAIFKKLANVVVNFVLQFIVKCLINIILFKILLLTLIIFLMIFVNSFKSIISLDICFDGGYFINMQKAKIYKC